MNPSEASTVEKSVTTSNISYPPGPKTRFAASIYLKLHGNPLGFLKELSDTYGDIVHLQLGPRHDYLISDPEAIKEVLWAPDKLRRSTPRVLSRLLGKGVLTSEQKFHGCQRRILQPAFSPVSMSVYAQSMLKISKDIAARWENKETINVADEMNDLTLKVVVQTLLGSEMPDEHGLHEALEIVKTLTDKKAVPFIDSLLWKIPCKRTLNYQKAKKCLDEQIYQIINEKRNQNSTGCDMVSTLLLAQKTEPNVWTDEQIRDEVMTMFLAGHETIGSALTWVWYLLSSHPEIETKLHAEVDQVLANQSASENMLPKLVYTKKIFLEAMRLYPPVWLMVRRPLVDVTIGGYQIPAGAYVHVSQYVVQHDARYFPNPEVFDPERWTPELSVGRPKFSYFPFGGGKRQCIGENFAMVEGILAIAAVAHRWKLKCINEDPIEIEPLITLRPKGGLQMYLTKRVKHG